MNTAVNRKKTSLHKVSNPVETNNINLYSEKKKYFNGSKAELVLQTDGREGGTILESGKASQRRKLSGKG